MSLNSLPELLIDQLRDLLSAETQLVSALPKVAKAAANPELSTLIENHLEETRGHVERLRQVFEILETKPTAKTCKAMKGLLEEGKEAMGEKGEEAVIDIGLVAAAQRVEHYEIAAYGTAIALAKQLGNREVQSLLEETLEEEKKADELLTKVCEDTLFDSAPKQAPASGGRSR
ncbi:MAG: ferritin-like domain-containing protein [Planctomycetes bacterium]|nr:ferritin-like domain-containing protein [Planctomycetota bacterium]